MTTLSHRNCFVSQSSSAIHCCRFSGVSPPTCFYWSSSSRRPRRPRPTSRTSPWGAPPPGTCNVRNIHAVFFPPSFFRRKWVSLSRGIKITLSSVGLLDNGSNRDGGQTPRRAFSSEIRESGRRRRKQQQQHFPPPLLSFFFLSSIPPCKKCTLT